MGASVLWQVTGSEAASDPNRASLSVLQGRKGSLSFLLFFFFFFFFEVELIYNVVIISATQQKRFGSAHSLIDPFVDSSLSPLDSQSEDSKVEGFRLGSASGQLPHPAE